MEQPEIIEISSLSQLQSFESAWNELLEQSTEPSPTQSFAWIYAYLRHKLEANARWLCLFAFDGRQSIGILTLIGSLRLGVSRFAVELLEIPYDASASRRSNPFPSRPKLDPAERRKDTAPRRPERSAAAQLLAR